MNDGKAAVPALDILLIEDNPGDVRLIKEAFRVSHPTARLHVASDGVEALAFLRQQADHSQAARPSLILLDLNLPRMDGREVLNQIKRDDALKTIPVAILTTSDSETDILESYQLQANCYLTKPVLLEDFETVVNAISGFWLDAVRLPTARRSSK